LTDVQKTGEEEPAVEADGFGMKLARGICFAVVLLFAQDVLIPWNTTFSSSLLDASWCLALHWAHVYGVDFGHDFVFTFGPWGFVYAGYMPNTFTLTVLAWSLFAVTFVAGLWELGRKLGGRLLFSVPWMLLVVGLAGSTVNLVQDVRLYAASWMLVLLHFYVKDRKLVGTKTALIVAMSLASLVKFSMTFMALGALGAVSFDQVRRKKWPWHLAVFLVAYLGLWLAAGQKVSSLGPFLGHSWNIVNGYAQAMGIAGPSESADLRLYLCGAAALLCLVLMVHFREKSKSTLAAVGGLAAMMFVTFKAGYVRHDFHEAIATTSLVLLALLYAAALWPTIQESMGRVMLMVVAIGFSTWLMWRSYSVVAWEHRSISEDLFETVWHSSTNLRMAWWWMTDSPLQHLRTDAEMEQIKSVATLPAVEGSVDIYPWAGGLLVANKEDYRPRPVIQSYQAYTGELAQIDADFLNGDRAPDEILFRVATIDARFPALDDGLSWPEILTRYDLKEVGDLFLRFTRAKEARTYSFVPLGSGQAMMGQPIAVPDSEDPVWVKIHLRRRLLGKLLAGVYRPPRVTIKTSAPSGWHKDYLLVPELADAGFLISPLVEERQQEIFARMIAPDWRSRLRGSRISSIIIGLWDDPGVMVSYEPGFDVEFFGLRFPHQDVSGVPGINKQPGGKRLQPWGG
jgi:hypothetical protein